MYVYVEQSVYIKEFFENCLAHILNIKDTFWDSFDKQTGTVNVHKHKETH